ncbi:putative ABC transporter [Gregarina niphandrodes]|uniref:ABC transporter n=1 Tax=Gregarina niphandrodes TaxID=110365 RepID=A0A023B593_GRENI|nr:putative ABC transporter [Gregarina niphandrodes]EZG59147.1 putative ABC transporter [Gregarina niphandrodes]|eukprot:XP_011130907.1 putative ABC transporter [Gregarina niphandrodes]
MLGISVATRNICMDLERDGVRVPFLKDINFLARPGEMTAIMGPSGCGKTTFLNILSNRQSGTVTGDILYDGNDGLLAHVNDFSAYVMQEDFFLQRLTVRETVVFAARLRLGHLSYDDQVARADGVLDALGLQVCKDVLIGGSEVKGISGGQRKRVSIAVALLDEPRVLFLDEPTSGLDAALAFDVIQTLRKIAEDKGRTIVCTIHQPRNEVYAMFDRLLLLRTGKCIYHGPCEGALEFFAKIGHPCPDDYNPADFFLDLLTEAGNVTDNQRTGEKQATETKNLEKQDLNTQRIQVSADEADSFAQSFDNYLDNSLTISEIEKIRRRATGRPGASSPSVLLPIPESQASSPLTSIQGENASATVSVGGKVVDPSAVSKEAVDHQVVEMSTGLAAGSLSTRPSWSFARELRNVYILSLRGIRESSRRPQFVYINFVQVFLIGTVVATVWFNIKKPVVPSDVCDVTVTRNAIGGMMQIVANTAFSSFDAAIQQINRRPLINREASGGLYSRPAAMVANWISDGCFHYWASFIYAIVVYWMMNLRHSAKAYLIWLLVTMTIKMSFWGSSTSVGALSPNIGAGMGLIPLTNVLLFLVSGYQISDDSIPKGLVWLKAISPIRYAWQTISRTQLDPNDTNYLERCMGFTTPRSWWADWLIMVAILVVARLLGIVAVATLHRNQGVQA